MAKRMRTFLETPVGTEGLHIQDAYRHRMITRTLEDTFLSWGYLPVQIPEFDFFDTYRNLFREEDLDRIYRLVDREGDLLMLRSDMTLFLARHLGLHLTETDLPSRVCYADSILRHENREDISRNEFFQAGAELVGIPGERGDLEILSLAYETFSAMGLHELKIHLGSRAALAACIESPEESVIQRLGNAVAARDTKGIAADVDENHTALLTNLLLFIGTPAEATPLLEELTQSGLPEKRMEAIKYPFSLATLVEDILPSGTVVLDYSEVGGQPYYSGIVFRGYMNGVDSEVLSGGRYDSLLDQFGFDCPSTGFSILLRKVESLATNEKLYTVPKMSQAGGTEFADALADAQIRRKNGEVIIL